MKNVVSLVARQQGSDLATVLATAHQRLREATTSVEALDAGRWAEGALSLAKVGKASDETIGECLKLVYMAKRRLGELIAAQKATVGMNKGAMGNPGGQGAKIVRYQDGTAQTPPTLADAGISKKLSSEAQALASVSEAKIMEAIDSQVRDGKTPTKSATQKAIKGTQSPKPKKPEAKQPKPKQPGPKMQAALDAIDRRTAAGEDVSAKAIEAESGANKETVRQALAVHEAEVKAADLPLPELNATWQQKFDAHVRRFEREFDERVREAGIKWLNEVRIPIYERKIDELKKIFLWPRNFVMPKAEYNKILTCLHPDAAATRTPTQLNEAFDIFLRYKLKMVKADEGDVNEALARAGLPRTREELLARKAQVREERRLARQKA